MQKHHKFSIWYVLLGVWVVLIVQNYLASTFAIPMEGRGEYSETTAELIDEEVRAIISDQYEKAFGILKEKTEILEKGAALLLEKEKIEGGGNQGPDGCGTGDGVAGHWAGYFDLSTGFHDTHRYSSRRHRVH